MDKELERYFPKVLKHLHENGILYVEASERQIRNALKAAKAIRKKSNQEAGKPQQKQ